MKHGLYLLTLLVFISCDPPGNSTERTIVNKTDKTINIYMYHDDIRQYPEDTIVAEGNKNTTMFVTGGLGVLPTPYHPMAQVDSVVRYIDNSALKKDLMDSTNWALKTEKSGKSYKHTYTFTITGYGYDVE